MPFPSIAVIGGIIELIKPALEVVQAFNGDDPSADDKLQEAAATIEALFPLVVTFTRGEEVTAEDARDALAGYDDAIDRLDALIAKKEAGG